MSTGAELTRRALAAALAVAARHGVRCAEPEILRDASNLLVRLRPAPVVARVMTVTSTFRTGDAWLAREVAIASYLTAAGAPVVAPSAEVDPGPHHYDGLVLSFWTYVDEAGRELDAAQAGRRLRICHELLEHFDGALPRLAAIEEAATVLDDLLAAGAVTEDDAAMLRHVGAGVREQIDELGLPLQAIHGDAHLNNVINGPDGPLWNDWEDCFLGPRAWDLGCLVGAHRLFHRDPAPVAAARAAYGESGSDDAELEPFLEARRLQGVVIRLVMARAQPERRDWHEQCQDLLAWYRERA